MWPQIKDNLIFPQISIQPVFCQRPEMKSSLIPDMVKNRRITPDIILEYCRWCEDSIWKPLTVFFSTKRVVLFAYAERLVWITTVWLISTSPPYCCFKRMRKEQVIIAQRRNKCSLCATQAHWSTCCMSSPCYTAPVNSPTVSVWPYWRFVWRQIRVKALAHNWKFWFSTYHGYFRTEHNFHSKGKLSLFHCVTFPFACSLALTTTKVSK